MTDELEGPHHTVEQVTIHAVDRDWAMGEFGPCLMVRWRGTVTERALLQINEQIVALTQRCPGKCAYINVIEGSSPTPPASLRKLTMEGLNRPGKALGCMVAVIEGNELRSTIVRAILTGMSLLRVQGPPTRFFKSTEEMSVWVRNHLATVVAAEFDRDIVRAAEVLGREMPT
jgi:hypothetical protein